MSANTKQATKDLESVGYNPEKYKALGYFEGKTKGIYNNKEGYLPELPNGHYYREWDVIKALSDSQRGIERFVTAHDSNGNVIAKYFTKTHYGTEGSPPFLRIE